MKTCNKGVTIRRTSESYQENLSELSFGDEKISEYELRLMR